MCALPYWNTRELRLAGSRKSKALRFVREGRVVRISPLMWSVRPIPGYNSTAHIVALDAGELQCDCQFWQTQKEPKTKCSHILAVLLYEKRKEAKK